MTRIVINAVGNSPDQTEDELDYGNVNPLQAVDILKSMVEDLLEGEYSSVVITMTTDTVIVPVRKPTEGDIFAFLNAKYTQTKGVTEYSKGMLYINAETHDLAKELAKFLGFEPIYREVKDGEW